MKPPQYPIISLMFPSPARGRSGWLSFALLRPKGRLPASQRWYRPRSCTSLPASSTIACIEASRSARKGDIRRASYFPPLPALCCTAQTFHPVF